MLDVRCPACSHFQAKYTTNIQVANGKFQTLIMGFRGFPSRNALESSSSFLRGIPNWINLPHFVRSIGGEEDENPAWALCSATNVTSSRRESARFAFSVTQTAGESSIKEARAGLNRIFPLVSLLYHATEIAKPVFLAAQYRRFEVKST